MTLADSLPAGLQEMLFAVLDAALELSDADFGNIQLLGKDERFRLVAQRGFPDWWIQHWDNRSALAHGVSAAALRSEQRIFVEDVQKSPMFSAPADAEAMARIDVQAAQSTPLRGRSGEVVGLLSTHYRRPCHPDERALKILDLLAEHAAFAIERAEADTALTELEARALAVYLHSPIGIFEVDMKTLRVIRANPAFCGMLGYTDAEIVGLHTLDDLTHPDDRALGWRSWKWVLRSGTGDHRDVRAKRYLRKSGEPVWVERDVSFVPDAHGGEGYLVSVVRDLTEQRRNEELHREQLDQIFQLQRLQTANELAGVLAHEINQPLTAIPMYAALAKQVLAEGAAPDREELGELLDRINQIALQAGEIIQRMRHFYARGAVDPSPMDLNTVIHSVEAVLEPVARRANIRLHTDLYADLPNVMGVEVHIEQVLLNLVRNAFDAIGGGGAGHGEVTVRTQCVDRMARVTVSDSGPGIDEEQAKRLFVVMGSTKADGLGMGLRISRSLVVAHKGRLWAEPHVPGGVFHFELPLA